MNLCLEIETQLSAADLLSKLHYTEDQFGRLRSERNAPRTLDLDVVDFDGVVQNDPGNAPILPHPRAAERAFVLLPLQDIAPRWVDPKSHRVISDLIAELDPNLTDECRPVEDAQINVSIA